MSTLDFAEGQLPEEEEEEEEKAEDIALFTPEIESREKQIIEESQLIGVQPEEDEEEDEGAEIESGEPDPVIFTIKTTIGQERNVADAIANRAKKKGLITGILVPPNLRGYFFVEGYDGRLIEGMISGIRHCRGILKRRSPDKIIDEDGHVILEEYGVTPIKEVEPFLTPKPLISGINVGDIVELISGPFKGERGKVKQIDANREEITVELFEALVPIPVTVRGDNVRVLEKQVG